MFPNLTDSFRSSNDDLGHLVPAFGDATDDASLPSGLTWASSTLRRHGS
jgi:hypothetical protein